MDTSPRRARARRRVGDSSRRCGANTIRAALLFVERDVPLLERAGIPAAERSTWFDTYSGRGAIPPSSRAKPLRSLCHPERSRGTPDPGFFATATFALE